MGFGSSLSTPPYQQEGKILDHRVETIDILPTMAEILGFHVPYEISGRSALGDPQENRESIQFIGWSKKLTLSPSIKERNKTLQRQFNIFGSGSFENVFNIGPYKHIVGQPLKNLNVKRSGDFSVEIDQPSAYENINLEKNFVPSCVTGLILIKNYSRARLNLAIAVNGTIMATTRTLPVNEGVAVTSNCFQKNNHYRVS